MNDRIPEDKPTRVPAGANRWWNQPRAIDLEGTERLRAIRGACAKSARLLEREPTDWKAGCGRSARPVWREGWSQNSTPTPISILGKALLPQRPNVHELQNGRSRIGTGPSASVWVGN